MMGQLLLAAVVATGAAYVKVPQSRIVQKPAFTYRKGGPLAGVELPPYPTYFGEPAGKPGDSKKTEYQLYPGGVEHFRCDEIRFFGHSVPKFDIQSQLYRFTAPDVPGNTGKAGRFAQAVHKIEKFGIGAFSGKREPEVDVRWCGAGDAILQASFDLPRGMYAVRCAAATRTEDQQTPIRKALIGEFLVTDARGREVARQHKYMNYMDQFYSMGEFFFHAPEEGVYNVRFALSKDSEVAVAVRDVLVEDALTGVDVRAIKTKSAYDGAVPESEVVRVREGVRAMDAGERKLVEDKAWTAVQTRYADSIWARRKDAGVSDHFFTGVPAELLSDLSGLEVDKDFNAVTERSFTEKYGSWRWRGYGFENEKLKLRYEVADFLAGRPIPAPYPLKGNALGLCAVRGDYEKLVLWRDFNFDRCRNQFYYEFFRNPDSYLTTLEKKESLKKWKPERIHANLIGFVRLAYDYPLLDAEMNETGYQRLKTGPWSRGALHHRTTYADYLAWYTEYQNYMIVYDRLFPLIKGNQALADAVGRHVPWVKTPEDVIKIFDAYMVQDIVKRCMRHQSYTMPGSVLTANRVLNYDAKLSDDFANWSFSSEFRYPIYGGLQYIMQNNLDRAGTAPSSSTFYAAGENGVRWAEELVTFSIESGERTYRFQDEKRYPKFRGALTWCHEMVYAGGQYPHIGDVAGPDRPADDFLKVNEPNYELAWRFWKDPASAALLHYVFGKTTDPELVTAAKTFDRLPYLTYPSRMIPNWCGILEIGKRHDDFRFRRGVAVRAGRHYGHSHEDSLDLQIAAHGLQYIADGGQRRGYAKPNSFHDYLHCTVTRPREDERKISREEPGCVSAIADGEHFASLTARASCGRSVRHVALVDVDDDGPAMRLPIKRQKPGVRLDPVARTPNAYVFDVFREKARGGKLSYNFHAANDVAEKFRWDAESSVAEWQICREPEKEGDKVVNMAYEPFQLGVNFDAGAPLRFLRLHLPGLDGQTVVRQLRYDDSTRGNRMTMLHAIADAPNGKVFAAIVEPYAGTPFIRAVKALAFAAAKGNWDDPVGIAVETTDGQRNVHLSSVPGRECVSGKFRLEGANGFVGYDRKGIRRAVLTGGTRLVAPGIAITAKAVCFEATVTNVDYTANTMTLDAGWDLSRVRFPKIVHVSNRFGLDTSFTVIGSRSKGGRTVLVLKEPANVYVSDIDEITTEGKIVGKQPVFEGYNLNGCTLVNSKRTKFWKSRGGAAFGATRPSPEDFAPDNVFSAWEYGPGDSVEMESTVSVERQLDGTYRTVSDVPCEVRFK